MLRISSYRKKSHETFTSTIDELIAKDRERETEKSKETKVKKILNLNRIQ